MAGEPGDSVRGVNLMRIRDGRIVEALGYVMGSQAGRGWCRGFGAGEGNRTLVCSLGSCRSTIELRPRAVRLRMI